MSYNEYQKKELGLGLNAFNRPSEYSGIDAWVRLIAELFFTIPGTHPTEPDLGVGIQLYRFSMFDEIKSSLEEKMNRQIRTYLPDIPIGSVTATTEQFNGNDILFVQLEFRVTDGDLKTAFVAVNNVNKTLDYATAF